MRILMVMMEGHGGMYQYGALLSNALAHEHDVHAIVPVGAELAFFDASVNVIPFPVGDTKRNFLPRFFRPDRMRRFLRTVNRVHPDVIHFHNPYNLWPCPMLPWLSRYKTVTTIPEGKLHRGMEKRLDMVLSRSLHILFSDAIVVLSPMDRDLLGKGSLGRKTFIIPHGINDLFVKSVAPGLPEVNSILFFGAALPFKGLEYLLKAFVIVREKVPEVKLLIAGRLYLKEHSSLLEPLGNMVEVDNRFIPPEDAARYLQTTKLVVLPYTEDDHSGLIPLVYSFGKPVVATSLVDMVEPGKTGLVVPPRDHLALAQAIITLLQDDQLRDAMKSHVRRKAREEFTWEHIAGETQKVYREVLRI